MPEGAAEKVKTMSDEVKLLPCPMPWCMKSKPELMQGGFRNGSYIVRCQTCGCETPRYYGTDRAIATWNTRSAHTRPPIDTDEVVERVAEALFERSKRATHTEQGNIRYANSVSAWWPFARAAIAAMKDAASD